MKKKFAKKRDRAATEDDDVNQNVVETSTKRVFLKPQVWADHVTDFIVFLCQNTFLHLCLQRAPVTVVEQHVQYFKADWMLYILFFLKRCIFEMLWGLLTEFLQFVQNDETFIKAQLSVFMRLWFL